MNVNLRKPLCQQRERSDTRVTYTGVLKNTIGFKPLKVALLVKGDEERKFWEK